MGKKVTITKVSGGVPLKQDDSVMRDASDSEPNGDFEFSDDEMGEEEQEVDEEEEDEEEELGREISPSAVFPNEGSTVLSLSVIDTDSASLHPQRPTPYIHDAGHLLITDPNPLPQTTPSTQEAVLTANARDAAQSLLNHLLTTCPIHKAPNSAASSNVIMVLPTPTFQLPREKKIPVAKAPTKWEQFAARKGINKRKTNVGRDGVLQSTEGNKVFNEETGEWVSKWGYKGRNKKGENDWLVEVDEKKEARTGEADDKRATNRAERLEKMKRNDRRQRANERMTRKKG